MPIRPIKPKVPSMNIKVMNNMFMKKLWMAIAATLATISVLRAEEPVCVVRHLGEIDGLNLRHANQILQDSTGFIWISAWNGLFRYDGQNFVAFKPQPGDGYESAGETIRTMWNIGNRIYCRMDEGNAVFDTEKCIFRDVTPEEAEFIPASPEHFFQSHPVRAGESIEHTDLFGQRWRIAETGEIHYLEATEWKPYRYRLSSPSLLCWMVDRQGNLWFLGSDDSVWKMSFVVRPFRRIDAAGKSAIQAIAADSRGRIWISQSADRKVTVTDAHFNRLGSLGPDGNIHWEDLPFGAEVNCIFHAADSVVWLGCKDKGLCRIIYRNNGTARTLRLDSLPGRTVNDIKADQSGRLWVATGGAGVICIPNPMDRNPRVLSMGHGLGRKVAERLRVRDIQIHRNILLAATHSGLLIAELPKDNLNTMEWRLHGRDSNRENSLSSNVATDVEYDGYNTICIGTESSGINLLDIRQDLLSDTLSFTHIGHEDGLGSDAAISLHYEDIYLYITGATTLVRYNAMAREFANYDSRFFHESLIFSEAHPLRVGDNWVLGLEDGMIAVSASAFNEYQYVPSIVWSSISLAGGNEPDYAVNGLQQLELSPDNRTFTLRFAALDLVNPRAIDYSFRFVGQNNRWMYLHGNNSITMLDMRPGTYYLEVHSTNTNGVWVPNARMLRIIVPEKFNETALANVLFLILIIIVTIGLTFVVAIRIFKASSPK